ncbi:MAG: cation-translocating P-type ATPase [Actinomycetales bacterium]|nr:cation-translocating P-type ATPase [Actinomycetales bacterium]
MGGRAASEGSAVGVPAPAAPPAWHAMSPGEVLGRTGSERRGLSGREAAERLEREGPNALPETPPKPLWLVVASQFKDTMIIVLLLAAAVSAVVSRELVDSAVIVALVLANAAIGTWQEVKAARSLNALRAMSAPHANALRDGEPVHLEARDLVVGDVVLLAAGDAVPADVRLVEAANLRVDESALTGESHAVDKSTEAVPADVALGDRTGVAFSATLVVAGRGTGVVTATGARTQVGGIAELIRSGPDVETPMQRRLNALGRTLGIAVLVVCAGLFVLGLAQGRDAVDTLMLAVSLAVAAIPEGLVAISTVVLALGVQRMAARGAIVRTLPAVETLGSTTVICSDKTGTLTQNLMTVVESWEPGGIDESEPSERLVRTAVLCTDASVTHGAGAEGKDRADGEDRADGDTPATGNTGPADAVVGDPTEVALVRWGLERDVTKPELEAAYPRIGEVPFDSARKRMTTVHRTPGGDIEVCAKGGVDEILAVCTGVDAPLRERIDAANDTMAGRALRVLALASRRIRADDGVPAGDSAESELEFLGLVGMIDPPREQVPGAVAECTSAGITTVMITGDHAATAEAIAGQIGLLDAVGPVRFDEGPASPALGPAREVITGRDVAAMSDDELAARVDQIAVYARVSPEDKVRIVEAWRARGAVVAMTGDGVNDAPALQRADIGCAMGVVGTDVAKDAADIVLTDDNFATIVAAVREGRRIEANVLKAISFLLSSNVGEVLALVVAIALGWLAPLAATHILLVNLVTDGAPALALGVDPADKDVMRRGPSRGTHIFTKGRVRRILYQGATFAVVTLAAFQLGGAGVRGPLELAQTMAFATLALSQVVHSFSVRSVTRSVFVDPPWRNQMLMLAAGFSAAVVAVCIAVPGLNDTLGFVPLTIGQWGGVLALSVAPLFVVEAVKALGWNEPRGSSASSDLA